MEIDFLPGPFVCSYFTSAWRNVLSDCSTGRCRTSSSRNSSTRRAERHAATSAVVRRLRVLHRRADHTGQYRATQNCTGRLVYRRVIVHFCDSLPRASNWTATANARFARRGAAMAFGHVIIASFGRGAPFAWPNIRISTMVAPLVRRVSELQMDCKGGRRHAP